MSNAPIENVDPAAGDDRTVLSVADANGVQHEIKCDAFAGAALQDILHRVNDLEAFVKYVNDALTYSPRDRKVLTAIARQIQRRAERILTSKGTAH